MFRPSLLLRLLREGLVPLLVACLALGGALEMRARAQVLAEGRLTLCTSEHSLPGDSAAHDCAACCLPLGKALPAPDLLPRAAERIAAAMPVFQRAAIERLSPQLRPWSRGPPARA